MKKRESEAISLSAEEAKRYFLKPQNYFSVPVPPYFCFEKILDVMSKKLAGHKLKEFCDEEKLEKSRKVNYGLKFSKDGMHAWREFQLIHPAIYVELVDELTEREMWEFLRERFALFKKQEIVRCRSLMTRTKDGHEAASAILKWWNNIEQESIRLGLYYNYMAITDVLECYNSIDLRHLERVFGGRGQEIIEWLIRMNGGKTIGLPQGNAVGDLMAELMLGYVDVVFARAVGEEKIKSDYQVLRFKDDYRIFTKDEVTAKKLLRILAESLAKYGLKLNPAKTEIFDDIVRAARKPDKSFAESQRMIASVLSDGAIAELSIQKGLIMIDEMSRKFPNSGSVQRALMEIYEKRVLPLEHKPGDVYQIMSVVANIMVRNPRTAQIGVAILSKMMSFNPGISRKSLTEKILEKARLMPNYEYLEVCLQRLTIKNLRSRRYKSELCQLAYKPDGKIWNSEWLKFKVEDRMIVDKKRIIEMEFVVPKEEVLAFLGYNESDENL